MLLHVNAPLLSMSDHLILDTEDITPLQWLGREHAQDRFLCTGNLRMAAGMAELHVGAAEGLLRKHVRELLTSPAGRQPHQPTPSPNRATCRTVKR